MDEARLGHCQGRSQTRADVPGDRAFGRHSVSVVVIAYHSGAALGRAVDSALRAGAHEILLVDNAPGDGAAIQLARSRPRTVYVRMPHNVGFAAGCNEGIARATQPFVLLLNDDAELTQHYLDVLVPVLRGRPGAAGAIGKLLQENTVVPRIDSAGIALHRWSLCARDIGAGDIDVGQFDRRREVFGVTGAAALYRVDVLRRVGGFDAALFAYYEDVDLAWRLGALGYVHLYEPRATAFHGRRGLSNKARDTVLRAHTNRYTVWAKNEAFGAFALRAPVALPREAMRMLHVAAREPAMCWAVCRGIPAAVRRGLRQRRATSVAAARPGFFASRN